MEFRFLIHGFLLVQCTRVYDLQFQTVDIIDHVRQTATVNQPSIYPRDNNATQKYYNASKAIDGQKCTDATKQCCSVTDQTDSTPSWWQIDLTDRFTVDTVEIYGRTFVDARDPYNSQLEHATIYAGNTSLILNTQPGTEIYTIPEIINTTHFRHELSTPVTAQYFYVQLSEPVLIICEFILYGKAKICQLGQFGQNCQKDCHCVDRMKCDILTGKCQSPDCLPGWTGSACNKDCSHQKFGKKCREECHCFGNSSCNNVNGSCMIGYCDPGWQGQSCNEDCKDGTFGKGCSQYCHCADNKPCDKIHGYCQFPICKLGWIGEACNESCPESTFGERCNQTCYCEDGTCSSDYGVCPGKCKTGYHGAHCNIEGLPEVEKVNQNSAAIISGSVAGCIVVNVVLVLLFVLIYNHRIKRIKRNENENNYQSIHRNMTQNDDETPYNTLDIAPEPRGQENEEVYVNENITGL